MAICKDEQKNMSTKKCLLSSIEYIYICIYIYIYIHIHIYIYILPWPENPANSHMRHTEHWAVVSTLFN